MASATTVLRQSRRPVSEQPCSRGPSEKSLGEMLPSQKHCFTNPRTDEFLEDDFPEGGWKQCHLPVVTPCGVQHFNFSDDDDDDDVL